MNKELLTLAVQSLRRRRKNTLLLLAVLFLSFAFSVASLAVTETMTITNEEYLLNTYGAWMGAIVDGSVKDEEFLREAPWLDKLGVTRIAGTFGAHASIGTADADFLEMSRFSMQAGRMPRAADEIAIEASTLDELGYDFQLGQTITLNVTFKAKYNKSVEPEISFKLCGILQAYSVVWDVQSRYGYSALNNAFVSEEGFQRVRDAANEEVEAIRQEALEQEAAGKGASGLKHLTLDYVQTHYFFTFNATEEELMDSVSEHYTSPRNWGTGRPVRNYLRFNYAAYGQSIDPNITTTEADRDASAAFIYIGFTFLAVLLAIFCIYAVQMQRQVRQLALFRSIGITRRQLRKMMLFETLFLCAPAAALGAVAGTVGAGVFFGLLHLSGSAEIKITVPWELLFPMALFWVLGVFLARLLILQIALHEPLTGRISSDSRKLRRYRRLRVAMAGALGVLLCGSLIFTVAESFPPANQMVVENAKSSFQIGGSSRKIKENNIKAWRNILGVTDVRAVGVLYPNMRFEGAEDAEAFQTTLARLEKGDDVTGAGTITQIDHKDAIGVCLFILPDDALDSYLDLSSTGMDMEAFRRGELVAVSFPQEPDGSYYMDSEIYRQVLERHVTMEGDYTVDQIYTRHRDVSDIGLHPGSKVTMEFLTEPIHLSNLEALAMGYTWEEIAISQAIGMDITTIESAAVLNPTVGAIVPVPSGTDTSFLELDKHVYVFWCSENFARKLLNDVNVRMSEKYPNALVEIGTYRQGGEFGFTSAEVFTDSVTGRYTDVMMENASTGFEFTSRRKENTARAQEHAQSLILLVSSGGCITLLMLLVLENTLTMESERLKKNYGIMQALGMSRRQLKRKLVVSALRRGLAGAAFGWLVWGGYVAGRAAMLYISQLDAPLALRYEPLQALKEALWRYLYAGAGVGTAVGLTLIAIALIAATFLFANRGLFRENLMDKLREES